MAQKLHDTYGFKYDDANGKPLLRVLLGGWNTWKQENAKDPAAYPTEITEGATTPSSNGKVPATIQLQPAPAGTTAPGGSSAPPPGLVPIPGKTP